MPIQRLEVKKNIDLNLEFSEKLEKGVSGCVRNHRNHDLRVLADSCPAHFEHLFESVGEKNPIPQEIHF